MSDQTFCTINAWGLIIVKLHFSQQRSLTAQLLISSRFLQVDVKWHQAMPHFSRRPLCSWTSSMPADSVWMTSWTKFRRICRYVGLDHCPRPSSVLTWLSSYLLQHLEILHKTFLLEVVSGCVEHKKLLDVVISVFYRQNGKYIARGDRSLFVGK